MCGIAGIFGLTYVPKEEDLRRMTSEIRHRGPDGEGIWIDADKKIGLGHRRLAIIDLSENGAQPMQYLTRYVITFNGEIYNYIELRLLLKKKGYTFNTQTDTEVILAAYDLWKEDCLKHFDGMFSFAIYDKQENELFCARDRFGEKPFYYFSDDEKFVFASEMKALWNTGVPKEVNPYSVYLFLNFDLEENPNDASQTFFRSIYRLKKAHYIKTKSGQKIVPKPYWTIDPSLKNTEISFENACKEFKELLYNSVRLRLRSDVPVGTSLSGGLDSSTVVLTINDLLKDKGIQKTFSARFPHSDLDEGYFMNKVIEGKQIQQYCTYPDSSKMIAQLNKIMYHQEEPFKTASIFAQWEVFKLAKENNAIVLLDGQGADEYLAGYLNYFVPYFREILKTKGNRSFKEAVAQYQKNNQVDRSVSPDINLRLETYFPGLFKQLRSTKRKITGVSTNSVIEKELYTSFKHLEAPFPYFPDLNSSLRYSTLDYGIERLLRFADRNSMAHSIEARLPFLDHKLVEFVFTLPSDYKIREGWTKALLRYGMKEILPKEITWRKNKLGFQPPQEKWEKEKQWKDWANDFHNISIKKNWVSKNASLSWKSVNLGVFANMLHAN